MGISVALTEVPSGRNVADGPSRRARLGEHPTEEPVRASTEVWAYRGQG